MSAWVGETLCVTVPAKSSCKRLPFLQLQQTVPHTSSAAAFQPLWGELGPTADFDGLNGFDSFDFDGFRGFLVVLILIIGMFGRGKRCFRLLIWPGTGRNPLPCCVCGCACVVQRLALQKVKCPLSRCCGRAAAHFLGFATELLALCCRVCVLSAAAWFLLPGKETGASNTGV